MPVTHYVVARLPSIRPNSGPPKALILMAEPPTSGARRSSHRDRSNISKMPGMLAMGEPLIVGQPISSRRFCTRRSMEVN